MHLITSIKILIANKTKMKIPVLHLQETKQCRQGLLQNKIMTASCLQQYPPAVQAHTTSQLMSATSML